MITDTTLSSEYLKELKAEVPATRKCLERIPETLFNWKPHERSMTMGYLALLVAEIPKWITAMIEISQIDFATYEHFQPKTTAELVNHFDENVKNALKSLENVSFEKMQETFYLKKQGGGAFQLAN